MALAALHDLEARARQIDRQWQRRLEQARYEADLARRRFLAVEPEHRLVARSLEREWHVKLADVERLEREDATRPSSTARLVSPEERQRILALAHDLPAVWQAPTTTHAERKPLLRCVIKDVTLTKQAATIHVAIRWQTETCTTLEVPRPPRSADLRRTDPAVIRGIGALAPRHTDRQIAVCLKRESAGKTGERRACRERSRPTRSSGSATSTPSPAAAQRARWPARPASAAMGAPRPGLPPPN